MGYFIPNALQMRGGNLIYINLDQVVKIVGNGEGSTVTLSSGEDVETSYSIPELKELLQKSGSKFHSPTGQLS